MSTDTVDVYRVHPAIGVARIGCSQEWFAGPEVRNANFVPPNGYRDAAGHIRRQSARFRIYRHTYKKAELDRNRWVDPARVSEVNLDTPGVDRITWKIHVANTKSYATDPAQRVPNDPGERTVFGRNLGVPPVVGTTISGDQVTLAQYRTDSAGRLIVLGGFGRAAGPGPLVDQYQNPGWYDDMADGPVKAEIMLSRQPNAIVAQSAWVVSAVPDYVHAIEGVITLYDLAFDLARRFAALAIARGDDTGPFAGFPLFGQAATISPSFRQQIYPVLHAAEMARWVSGPLHMVFGSQAHRFEEDSSRFARLKSSAAADEPARRAVFDRLRRLPDASRWGEAGGDMPLLAARLGGPSRDNPISFPLMLTETQLKTMWAWATGDFVADFPATPPVPPASLESLPELHQPGELDRAHMCSMLGGGFYLGMEVGGNVRDERIWAGPFRISDTIKPGALTTNLPLPWHTDFGACFDEWWPSHRPDVALPASATSIEQGKFVPWASKDYKLMLDDWKTLGFLRPGTVGGQPAIVQHEKSPSHTGPCPT